MTGSGFKSTMGCQASENISVHTATNGNLFGLERLTAAKNRGMSYVLHKLSSGYGGSTSTAPMNTRLQET